MGEWLTGVRLRLRALLRGRRHRRDVEEELRFHRTMRESEYRRAGLDPAAARARSRARFGDLQRVRDECLEVWSLWPLDALRQEAMSAGRTLRRDPGFTAFVVATLALGVGAATTVLGLLGDALLRPLPVPVPEELFLVHWTNEKPVSVQAGMSFAGCEDSGGAPHEGCATSFPTFERLREAARPTALAAFSNRERVQISTGDAASFATARYVSGSYFAVLGLSAHRGRLLRDADDRDGAAAVAVVSHALWRSAFGGAPDLVGRSIRVNGMPLVVVGVAPPEFHGVDAARPPELWLPVRAATRLPSPPGRIGPSLPDVLLEERTHLVATIGRRDPSLSLERIEGRLRAALAGVMREHPEGILRVEDGADLWLSAAPRGLVSVSHGYAAALRMLLPLVGVVVVIACANAAGLLLTRAARRYRELTLRLALGASLRRLTVQLLAEGLLLASAGVLVGLLGGLVASRAVALRLAPELPPSALGAPWPAAELWGAAVAVVAAAATFFGLAPSWVAARLEPSVGLRLAGAKGAGRGAARLGRVIVAGEVALALVILVGAALLVRTIVALVTLDTGFRGEGLLSMQLSPVLEEESAASPPPPFALRDRLGAIPRVGDVSWSGLPMLSESVMATSLVGESPDDTAMIELLPIGPGFFESLELPLLAGRAVSDADCAEGARSLWVNAALAEKHLGGVGAALGAPIRLAGRPEHAVAGVVADARFASIRRALAPTAYVPRGAEAGLYVLRSSLPASELRPLVESAVRESSPGRRVDGLETWDELMRRQTRSERLLAHTATWLGGLALAMSAVGLYGVLAWSVEQRRGEIGVRVALGADRGDVLRLVLREGLGPMAAGLLLGAAGAFWGTRLTASLLFGVERLDPLAWLAAAAVLVSVGLAAGTLPAARAARLDPSTVLRSE